MYSLSDIIIIIVIAVFVDDYCLEKKNSYTVWNNLDPSDNIRL